VQGSDDGVVAEGLEVVEIAEVARLIEAGAAHGLFTAREEAYARSRADPERRLAARLAAKRAAVRLLGGSVDPGDLEVLPARGGPPGLGLSPRAERRAHELGAWRAIVSLTHGETHAAASVLLLRE
jgi:phosphopantetheinyl transferase (holo-ACP synthase)